MSWTRSSGTRLRLRATPSGTVNYVLRQMFSPTMLQRSPLRKLPAVLMNTFFTFAYHIHKLITSDMQSHSQSQTLLIWSVSCISSAVQMVLICWLMFITAPVVQRLFELVAGACLNLYTVFGFLIETVLYYASLAIIVFIAAAGTFIVHRFFKVNWLRYLVPGNNLGMCWWTTLCCALLHCNLWTIDKASAITGHLALHSCGSYNGCRSEVSDYLSRWWKYHNQCTQLPCSHVRHWK